MSQARTQALALDAADPLRPFRNEFLVPRHRERDQVYFVGNSLGLQPRGARAQVLEVLDKWAGEAVEGHFSGPTAWMNYHGLVREPLARLVGAQPGEVVAMNTLTVNLHLMMASFYRPTREATWRFSCTTMAPTSRCGAATSTSTPGRAR